MFDDLCRLCHFFPSVGYIQRAGGLESYAEYPFTDSGPDAQSCNLNGKCGKCKFSEDKVVTTITGYQNVTWTDPVSGNPGDEKKLADAVATNGPLSVCIDSDPWRFYEGGILTYGARSNINHWYNAPLLFLKVILVVYTLSRVSSACSSSDMIVPTQLLIGFSKTRGARLGGESPFSGCSLCLDANIIFRLSGKMATSVCRWEWIYAGWLTFQLCPLSRLGQANHYY